MWSVDVGHHSTGDEGYDGEQEEAIIDSEAMRLVCAGADDCSAGCYDQCYREQHANSHLRLCELRYYPSLLLCLVTWKDVWPIFGGALGVTAAGLDILTQGFPLLNTDSERKCKSEAQLIHIMA